MIALKVETPMTTETQTGFKIETVDFINDLIEQGYSKDGIYQFIAEHNENDFIQYYETYVSFSESYSYDAVDAFIQEFGVYEIERFEDAYRGEYSSKGDYAEQYVSDCYTVDIPGFLEIDWEASFENLDCIYVNGFVFDRNY